MKWIKGGNVVHSCFQLTWCRSGFTTLPPVLLQEQPAVVLCMERALVSWLLARDGHGEHSGLRGSCRRSVTPYVHGRRELYCSSLASPV
jgi:hypothetical protein